MPSIPNTYTEALDFLYGLINYESNRPPGYTPEVISLDRPARLLAALGDPQDKIPAVHVAGTKGKGSVCAMAASMLRAAGLKVGLYISPHLQDLRERFSIDGQPIPPDDLTTLVARIAPLTEQIPGVTWFEVMTAIGFTYFADQQVDVAVIEVGLGGRLDATNLIRHPLVSVITSLSYDHMQLLGNTLDRIAYEKAGIIKPGCPVVSAPQAPEALAVIERIAAERGSPLTLIERDWQYEAGITDLHGQALSAGRASESPDDYWTPLIGAHQALNATVALAALDQVRQANIPKISVALTDSVMRDGLRSVTWPGRFEVIRRNPLVILDVAHNGASADRVAETITAVAPGQKWTLVFGAFMDKDVEGMYRALLPHADRLILTQSASPRAFAPNVLAAKAREAGFSAPIEVIVSAADAVSHAVQVAESEGRVLVTGSVALIGEIRDSLVTDG